MRTRAGIFFLWEVLPTPTPHEIEIGNKVAFYTTEFLRTNHTQKKTSWISKFPFFFSRESKRKANSCNRLMIDGNGMVSFRQTILTILIMNTCVYTALLAMTCMLLKYSEFLPRILKRKVIWRQITMQILPYCKEYCYKL